MELFELDGLCAAHNSLIWPIQVTKILHVSICVKEVITVWTCFCRLVCHQLDWNCLKENLLMTEGKTKRNNFACLASLFSQGVTEPAVWYPLKTLHMCWLEPVPCHLQSLLLLCLRATQSMETLSDIEAQSALWEEGVVLRETCPHPLDGSSQGALSGVSHTRCLPGPT